MRIGVVKERMDGENRVALSPASARELARAGHEVMVEAGAGLAARFADQRYTDFGGRIVDDAGAIWRDAELLLKVKEPQPEEYDLLHPGLTLFGYLHVAGNRDLAQHLRDHQVTAIAYELVREDTGYRPILDPMLEIAGSMGMLLAFTHNTSTSDGRGKIPGGVPGVAPTVVRILGANALAFQAARTAGALGADVVLIDPDVRRLRRAHNLLPACQTLVAHPDIVARAAKDADILVNTYPRRASDTGYMVTREHVRSMREQAMLVDLSADRIGAVETSRPTTFLEPTYVEEGITHFCVTNVPSCVARAASFALTNATLPLVLRIAELGVRDALRVDAMLRSGLVTIEGQFTDPETAEWFGATPVRPKMVLGLEY